MIQVTGKGSTWLYDYVELKRLLELFEESKETSSEEGDESNE